MLLLFFVSICFGFSNENEYFQRMVIGQTELKRDIVVEQFGDGEEVITIISSIHGNESIGTPLLHRFLQEDGVSNLEGRTVFLLYVANPDGYVSEMRGNSNNVDINRNLPTENFGKGIFNGKDPLSAIESAVLIDFIEEYQPDRTLIIHQPLNGIDYDGASKALAEHLSEKSGIRIKRLGARSGSIGSYLGLGLKKQVITLEIPERYSNVSMDRVCEKYCILLTEFVTYSP